LDQVPLVTVTPTGAVTLRESSAVQILINGKRSGLTMNDALDQIPSDNIERVEVITNPSSKFDASGSAGIINIILKKNKGQGWNGQVRATVGTPADYSVMPGVNFKGKKVNLFGNLRWRYSDYIGTYSTDQRTTENGLTNYLKRNENENRHDDGRSGYFGGDYYINDKNSITLAYFRAETMDSDLTKLNYTLTEEGNTTNELLRTGNSLENRNYNQIEFNYTHDFEEDNHELTFDFQYDFWNSTKDWNLLTEGNMISENIGRELRTNNIAGSKDFAFKTDYSKPLKENAALEMGLKVENRKVKNDYLAESLIDENWTVFQDINNAVDYGERIGGAYLQFQNKWKNIEYQIGLRSEYTMINIEDINNDYTDEKSYLNFFPTAHLSYGFNDKNTLQLSYSKRINRPSLWSIYPFSEITDFNFQRIGNPALNPSYSDSYELTLLSTHDKITINPNIYYQQINNPIQDYLEQNEQGTFIIKPVNIDSKIKAGFELSVNYQPAKMIRLSGEFSAHHYSEEGTYNGVDLGVAATTWNSRLSARISLPSDIQLQTRFSYYGAQKLAQVEYLAASTLSFGISKDFMNDKLNISIQGSNVLNTMKLQAISTGENFTIENSSQRYGARFRISAVYKINQTARDRMRRENRQNR